MKSPQEQIYEYLHMIIDETHPLFSPITDEEILLDHNEEPFYTDYTRTFMHKNGTRFIMNWRVYDGTPDTVKTIF